MPTDCSTIDYYLISRYAKDSFCASGLDVIRFFHAQLK